MLIEILLNLAKFLLDFIFALLPDIPNFNISLLDSLTQYINLIFDNVGLLGFFVRISTIKTLVPLVIIVINFERIYHFVIWIVHKLPISID